jgi:hypothetical protein
LKRNCLIAGLVSLIICLAMLVGCSANTPPPTVPNPTPNPNQQQGSTTEGQPASPTQQEQPSNNLSAYFPLAQGNTWQYLGEGNEYAGFKRTVLYTKENLAQVQENNGGTIIMSVFQTTDESITRIYFQGEVYDNTNFLDQQPNDNTIILKAPLQVGTTWKNKNETREIVDTNATVNTPAGEFKNCLKVKLTYPESTIYEYYQAGVGLVKREFLSEGFEVTSTLESWQPGDDSSASA